MTKAAEIKNLKNTLATLEESIKQAKQRAGAIKVEINDFQQQAESIRHKLTKYKGLQITEHALLRLCERKFGIPMDKVEQQLKELLEPMLKNVVSGKFPIGDGLRAVITEKRLITIEPV